MQFYFIRHAQSENNALWDQTGSSDGRSSDPELTDTGRLQSDLLAQFLSQEPVGRAVERWDPQNRLGFVFSHLYTSLMVRAVATAVPLARALNLPLQAWPDLHEIGGIYLKDKHGDPAGMPGKDRIYFVQNYPELQINEDFNPGGWWNRPHEPDEAAPERARRVLETLLEHHGDSSHQVAVVSHGGFYNVLLSEVLGYTLTSELWLLMNNTAITRLDLDHGRINLVYHNRVEHLPDHLVT
jgi:2,3-bisphosphoglycerate-dependent phosphoglycerate mutase